MENKGKTREQLSQELTRLHQRIAELEGQSTERKQAEEALHLAKGKAERYLNIAPSIILALDTNGVITLLNEGGAAILECDQNEVTGKNWFSTFLPERMQDSVKGTFQTLMSGDLTPVEFVEHVVLTAKGNEKTILWHNSLLYDKEDNITGTLSSGEDVTERKRAQEEVRQLSQFRESIINNAHMWLNVLDRKGNVVIWNKVAEDLSGYPSEEVIGHGKIWEWLYPDEVYRRKIEAKLEDILEGGEVLEGFETTIRCKDGRSRIISWNERNLSDRDGKVSGSIALGQDVTEQRRLEREIEERQLYLEGVLAAVPDALITLDSSHRIVEWNSGAERLFGYSRNDVIGGNIDDLITAPDVSEEAVGITRLAMSGKEVPPTEAVRYRKDGRPVNVILAGSSILVGDKVIGSIAAYTDITERVHAERELRGSAQKIERLHEVAGQLGACRGEDEVYRLTVEAAERTLSFSICTLDIVEEDRLVVKATSSASPPGASSEDKLEKGGLAAKTYRTKETTVFGRIEDVPEAAPTQTEFKSGISTPIGDIGVFQVASTKANAFTDEDAHMIDLLLGHTYEAIRRIRLQEDLKHQAIHDPLTGVYNRRYFNERIGEEVERSRRYDHMISFLMIDIDRFKEINDTFGHQMGDKVLQTVADVLHEQVRENDLVVRYGGDEFLVVLPETNGELQTITKRIQEAVAKTNKENPLLGFPVTLSIGAAHWQPEDDLPIEQVLAKADERMYEEKRQESNE